MLKIAAVRLFPKEVAKWWLFVLVGKDKVRRGSILESQRRYCSSDGVRNWDLKVRAEGRRINKCEGPKVALLIEGAKRMPGTSTQCIKGTHEARQTCKIRLRTDPQSLHCLSDNDRDYLRVITLVRNSN